jgi:putative endonuclease
LDFWIADFGLGEASDVVPDRHSRENGESSAGMTKKPAVYILASKRNGTLYIGVTNSLPKRAWEHKNDLVEGFTKKYGVHHLVYYEIHEDMTSAIIREKQIKKWNRLWKLELIEKQNPTWKDLFDDII